MLLIYKNSVSATGANYKYVYSYNAGIDPRCKGYSKIILSGFL